MELRCTCSHEITFSAASPMHRKLEFHGRMLPGILRSRSHSHGRCFSNLAMDLELDWGSVPWFIAPLHGNPGSNNLEFA